jgi:phage shock protein A
MGVFTRLRDIISSNINAMLDAAEDPEKLIRLMVQEMEDTLIEVKASCAGAIAARKKAERAEASAKAAVAEWQDRAGLAIDRGREDLAREALREKKKYEEKAGLFAEEVAACGDLVAQYKQDIAAVEAKIQTARDKHRLLAQRHARARNHKQAQTTLRKADSLEALARFDRLENRIERMEAEADLVDPSSNAPLVEQFEALKGEDELDRELAALKQQRQGG